MEGRKGTAERQAAVLCLFKLYGFKERKSKKGRNRPTVDWKRAALFERKN